MGVGWVEVGDGFEDLTTQKRGHKMRDDEEERKHGTGPKLLGGCGEETPAHGVRGQIVIC